jgi:hypothetical protein
VPKYEIHAQQQQQQQNLPQIITDTGLFDTINNREIDSSKRGLKKGKTPGNGVFRRVSFFLEAVIQIYLCIFYVRVYIP